MFTGIVEGLATVARRERAGPAQRLTLDLGPLARGARAGDSISVNGCCLTIERLAGRRAVFFLAEETLRRTALGDLRAGDAVNVERSLRAGARLHGHIVQGHVDGVGRVASRRDGPGQVLFRVRAPRALLGGMIEKGSVAVDGVSLTVIDVDRAGFSFMVIPHTARVTNLGRRRAGERVNLEVDVVGKWVRKLVSETPRPARRHP
jgi:riboflavin synthase